MSKLTAAPIHSSTPTIPRLLLPGHRRRAPVIV